MSHRVKALRGPNFKVKDYPYRVSFILRQGTWWVVERAQDLRLNNKPCYLEVTMFLSAKASYKVDSLSQLTPESFLINCLNILLILFMEVLAKAGSL